ncbi:glutamate--tRNA ligase [Actinokineospora globicatena]|uniref:glutamate--tRNA ligase n=1 Tax=Actinokineospora globicatena TaxID=103729 RepID=UPI0020A4A97E|nr:glutamate--tRNA ligase family protein [Actinokineospora globicatena]MCP2306347.1 glutamyl-tRNA synthetase [Actinokineospora globicatena]GLW81774.1 glutamate--tRNA ligase [Actinokineospora globicatena]GLW88569.1 glutamate--tRNA ligase [Actinokineospora globicatena]
MSDRAAIDALFPADLPDPEHWERRYPARELPEGAKVTRFGPSPTGFVHIGGVYVSTIDKDISARSGGVYIVRVEDTDQSREVEGALAQFTRAFDYFDLRPDEGDDAAGGDTGAYGPYHQSARESIYLTYVRELLREGKAYLCFATKDELADISAKQQATKLPTGYYGRWALWRDADPAAVAAKLAEGVPYVVRFRVPDDGPSRVRFTDEIRGELEAEANRNDAVILKSSDTSPRLPTYHFAHAVDDHLMRVNQVIRGEEWISSVPLHLQLFAALGFEPVPYAHIAPLMKQIPGGKRKLSKRKDPEAGVDFYIEAGYPAAAILYYLRGLANGRLAEVPLAEALATPISLAQCGVAGPLVDLVKLEDISADHVSTLTSDQVYDAVRAWAEQYDKELSTVLDAERDLALRAIAVEREGVENPRKDLRKWSDFRAAYGFFFPALFTPLAGPTDDRVTPLGVATDVVTAFATDLADGYTHAAEQPDWFNQVRELATKHGFAPSPKDFKKNPEAFPGSIREASQLVRVALTGSTRSPDLHAISQALGADEVLRRLRALAG